jgi:hypothetical protein
MGRKKVEKPGYGKLLDAWDQPDNAGEPIGCIATTFTFSPTFFEEECLSRFLRLETDATEDGPAYLVEREEKLAQLACAAAVVDQHHCKGVRSLRWDLLPVRPKGGVQHAKVALLHWSHATRVIVASANLTEDGYRRNQEVFGVLDYSTESKAPAGVLRDVIEFLRQPVLGCSGADTSPAIRRSIAFLDRVWQEAREWGEGEEQHGRSAVRVRFLPSTQGSADVITELAAAWPGGSPPSRAWVISPFFDPPEDYNRPASALWNIMRKRGETQITYCVEMDTVPGGETLFARAPTNLLTAKPNRESASNHFWRLKLPPNRRLHAKAIWLEDDRWAAYMIGSSNFTSAGLGLRKNPNIEANLLYIVGGGRARKAYDGLCRVWPEYDDIEDAATLRFQPSLDEGTDSADDEDVLPEAFGAASFDQKNGTASVTLTIKGTPPLGWVLLKESVREETCFSEVEWRRAGSPAIVDLPWADARPPSGFWVNWTGCRSSAWLPVNVASVSALPPPDELRDLPLDALIDILTSARPLHLALSAYLARRSRKDRGGTNTPSPALVDPHRRVDTTGFLLQRTRRVSMALNGIRERLERPVVSKESLDWRLRGPVGALALRNALVKEAKSDEERMFLLSELALELDRCSPRTAAGCLPVSTVRSEIRRLAGEIVSSVRQDDVNVAPDMRRYIDVVAGTVAG